MRILVTGAAGFIGRHLVQRLILEGHQVFGIDNDYERVAECYKKQPNVRWLWAECQDLQDLANPHRKEVRNWKPDFIYHLASTVGVARVLQSPISCIQNNLTALQGVLWLGVPGIFTSTSEVYGMNRWTLKEDSPIQLSSKKRWSYAASKLCCEWIAQEAGWQVVRLFNVVGPGQSHDYGAVLPTFVRQGVMREPILVFGDGSQIRTFIDVRDCADILGQLKHKKFDVVNVGSTHIYSIMDLADLISSQFHVPIKKIPYDVAYPTGFEECPSRIPDLTKLSSLLSSIPKTDFTQTIDDLAATFTVQQPTVQ